MGKSRSKARSQRAVTYTVDIELSMECEEEELSPAQKAANKKAQQENNSVKKLIDQYKANNAIIEILKVPLTPAQIASIESKPVVKVEEFYSEPVITYTPLPIPQVLQRPPEKKPQQKPSQKKPQQVSKKSTTKEQARPVTRTALIQHSTPSVKPSRPTPSPPPSTSSRPQRKAARNATRTFMGLDADDGADIDNDDDDVIIVPEMSTKELAVGALSVKSRNRVPITPPPVSPVLPKFATKQTPSNQPAQVTSPDKAQASSTPVQDTQVVSGTHGLGVKRAPGSLADIAPPAKKRPVPKKAEEDTHLVPLDEYYYGKKEGDPAYREEKGEYRFKCWYCHKMLYNNIRIMMHMQGHIDSEKQQSLELSDLTQCKNCYKQFDTPFEMQCHVEKVHQNNSNVLVCRICEKDHDHQAGLRQHMKTNHNACEMPYICQLCNFRSSWYSDVVDHFKKRHDSSQYVVCVYCLKVFKVAFSKQSGWGLTQNFYQHIQKHQTKGNNKKCTCCKLAFINKVDVKMHRQRDHLPNFRGAMSAAKPLSTEVSSAEQVMIKLPSDKGGKVKSLNAPTVSKVQEIRGVRFNWVSDTDQCKECGNAMNNLDHFKKYVECSLCRYATTCNEAYSYHMMGFHSGNLEMKLKSVPIEKPLAKKWFCLCGFNTDKGNSLANHLVICSKRTGYLNRPEQKFFEYDDEQEEFNPFEPYEDEPELKEKGSPEKEIPSLFGALGLVRKADKPGMSRKDLPTASSDMSPEQIATGVMDNILDNMFAAEVEASHAVECIMRDVNKAIRVKKRKEESLKPFDANPPSENIPPELMGSKKWSTVKIPDRKTPTKASVFLGSEDKEPEKPKEFAENVDDSEKQSEKTLPSESIEENPDNQVEEKEDENLDRKEMIRENTTENIGKEVIAEENTIDESDNVPESTSEKEPEDPKIAEDTETEMEKNSGQTVEIDSENVQKDSKSQVSDTNADEDVEAMDTESLEQETKDEFMDAEDAESETKEKQETEPQNETEQVEDTETHSDEPSTGSDDMNLLSEAVQGEETDKADNIMDDEVPPASEEDSIKDRGEEADKADNIIDDEVQRASEEDSIKDRGEESDNADNIMDDEGQLASEEDSIKDRDPEKEAELESKDENETIKDSEKTEEIEDMETEADVDRDNTEECNKRAEEQLSKPEDEKGPEPEESDTTEKVEEEPQQDLSPTTENEQAEPEESGSAQEIGEETTEKPEPKKDKASESEESEVPNAHKEVEKSAPEKGDSTLEASSTSGAEEVQPEEKDLTKPDEEPNKIAKPEDSAEILKPVDPLVKSDTSGQVDTKPASTEEKVASGGLSQLVRERKSEQPSSSERQRDSSQSSSTSSRGYRSDTSSQDSSRDRSRDSSRDYDRSRNRRDDNNRSDQRHRDYNSSSRDRYDNSRDRHDNRNWQGQGGGGYNRDNRYGGGGSGYNQNRRDDRYGNNQRGGNYRNDGYNNRNNRGRGGYRGGGYGGYQGGGGYY